MLLRERMAEFGNRIFRTKNGIFAPDQGIEVPRFDNILAVITKGDGQKLCFPGQNIVTDDGDIYYAQLGAGESPTNAFTEMTLSTNAFSPVPSKTSDSDDLTVAVAAGSGNKAKSASYPRTNDPDGDNSGAGPSVTSWLFSYAKADFNDPSIEGFAVHVTGATFGAATADPLLTAFNLTSFGKTADDSLKVFVNHTHLGV